MTDIRNAVAAGKIVTTSEKSINFNGWKGSGYIITDPSTGSGAYMISGGLNGGFILGVGIGGAISTIGIFLALNALALTAIPTFILFFGLVLALLSAMLILVGLAMVLSDNADMDWACFVSGLGVGLALGGVSTVLGITVNLLSRTITAIGLGIMFANFFPSFPTYPQCLGYA